MTTTTGEKPPMRKPLAVLATLAVAVLLAACQQTTTHPPLRVTTDTQCDPYPGLDINVENIGQSPVPVTVTWDGYAAPTRTVVDRTVFSFPGSTPDQVWVRLGGPTGAGWIIHDLDYCEGAR